MHIYICIHIHTCIFVCTHMFTHICIHIHTYTYTYIHTYTYTYIHTHIYIYIETQICIHIYIHTYKFIYIYIYYVCSDAEASMVEILGIGLQEGSRPPALALASKRAPLAGNCFRARSGPWIWSATKLHHAEASIGASVARHAYQSVLPKNAKASCWCPRWYCYRGTYVPTSG